MSSSSQSTTQDRFLTIRAEYRPDIMDFRKRFQIQTVPEDDKQTRNKRQEIKEDREKIGETLKTLTSSVITTFMYVLTEDLLKSKMEPRSGLWVQTKWQEIVGKFSPAIKKVYPGYTLRVSATDNMSLRQEVESWSQIQEQLKEHPASWKRVVDACRRSVDRWYRAIEYDARRSQDSDLQITLQLQDNRGLSAIKTSTTDRYQEMTSAHLEQRISDLYSKVLKYYPNNQLINLVDPKIEREVEEEEKKLSQCLKDYEDMEDLLELESRAILQENLSAHAQDLEGVYKSMETVGQHLDLDDILCEGGDLQTEFMAYRTNDPSHGYYFFPTQTTKEWIEHIASNRTGWHTAFV